MSATRQLPLRDGVVSGWLAELRDVCAAPLPTCARRQSGMARADDVRATVEGPGGSRG